jgi:hypothetical protein
LVVDWLVVFWWYGAGPNLCGISADDEALLPPIQPSCGPEVTVFTRFDLARAIA